MSWELVPLSEVAAIERISVPPDAIVSGTTYVGLEHIASGGETLKPTTVEAGELASNKFAFDADTILYGKLRPYLAKIVAPDVSGVCSTDILPIRPGRKLEKAFLLHFLRSPSQVAHASNRATGINLPRLSPKELAATPIPLPPLDEQRRIAGILDAADALRRQRREALALLDTLPGAIFADLFGDDPNSAGDWPIKKFGDLVSENLIGLVRGAKQISPDLPIPYLKMDCITPTGRIDLGKLVAIEASPEEIKKYSLAQGDLLFNTRNTKELVGKSAVYFGPENVVFNNNVMRVRTTDETSPDFLSNYLRSPYGRRQLEQRKSGTTSVFAVYAKNLMNLPVPVPPKKLVRDFSDRCGNVREMRGQHIAHLSELEALFSSLQARAFAGEL